MDAWPSGRGARRLAPCLRSTYRGHVDQEASPKHAIRMCRLRMEIFTLAPLTEGGGLDVNRSAGTGAHGTRRSGVHVSGMGVRTTATSTCAMARISGWPRSTCTAGGLCPI